VKRLHRNPKLAVKYRVARLMSALLCLSAMGVAAQNAPPNAPAPDTPATRDLKPIHPPSDGTNGTLVDIPRSYALIIGVSHYPNLPATAQLLYPVRDADEMYSTLISPEGGQFPPEHVHKLVNEQVTLANLQRELEQWLPGVTQPNDRVVIYFAGHGFISSGQGYLAPSDIDLKNIAGTAYPMSKLGEVVGSRIRGKWKVLITDACHSGAITPEDDRAQLNQKLLDLHSSLLSLTASRDREQSFESADWGGGHGIFTYYVVQGLRGAADTNGDGIVTADELSEYVHTNVKQATNGRQNPTSERGSFDPNMLLAYNPTMTKATPLQAPKFGSLVIEANLDGTEVWVDGKSVGVVNKGQSLRLPGLLPGTHTIKGFHQGYEPDGPRDEQVYPGQESTVSLRVLIPRMRNKAATDLLDKGIEAYQNGSADNYRKAEGLLQQAIAIDPKYSVAYVYLGRVEGALFEENKANDAFRHAIDIDPDYMDARSSYAAVLLDQGDMDEAVRQLDVVTQHQPDNATAWYLLSQAYARRNSFQQGKDAADRAVQFAPANGEAHFWLATCLRHLNQFAAAEKEYKTYLELSNYDSGKAGKVSYYLLGYTLGIGSKRRAAQADIWRELRGEANLGICDCEALQKNFAVALPYCQIALSYTPQDLWANYRLGTVYIEQSNQNASPALLSAARTHFQKVIDANPDTEEAARARQYISKIDVALSSNP
jgi:tetratricopeptide (TPR) repeat protein